MVTWANEHFLVVRNELFVGAAGAGQLEIMKHASETMRINIDCFEAAAKNGHLHVLQWLFQENFPWNERLLCIAAINGQLEVCKWALTTGKKHTRTDEVAVLFVRRGELEGVKWAKSVGFSCTNVITEALTLQFFRIAEWAVGNIM